MSKKRLLALVATAGVAVVGAAVAILPMTASNAAEACVAGYNNSTVYTGGQKASYNGYNWTAKWWTQYEAPSTGGSGVWDKAKDTCGGSGGSTGGGSTGGGSTGGGSTTSCNYPNWVAKQSYTAGAIVKYTNGQFYKATHDNPGYDPVESYWYWSPYTCTTTPGTGGNTGGGGSTGGAVMTQDQFNAMFPGGDKGFYSYSGLFDAMKKFPQFAGTGSDTVKKQEMAAFLANVDHETGGLQYKEELNQAVWGTYCDWSQPYGCPAGQTAYHGRGPIQLSWNFNYKQAGDALNINLLANPGLVSSDSSIAWQTGLWYWTTGTGNAGTTSHNAMVNGQGFGMTIRAINSIECAGAHPDQVQSRVNSYNKFVGILGVPAGGNLYC